MSFEKIFSIPIESGLLQFSDPTYLRENKGINRNPFFNWNEFLKDAFPSDIEHQDIQSIGYGDDKHHALLMETGGDGTIDVFIERGENGQIKQILLRNKC